jgi:hypothetical protein
LAFALAFRDDRYAEVVIRIQPLIQEDKMEKLFPRLGQFIIVIGLALAPMVIGIQPAWLV